MGVHRFLTIAMGMAMVVIVVVMAMSVIVLLFHRQRFDPCAAVDRDQRLVLGTFEHRLQKALHPQAIDHQHLGLAEAGHILGTRLVGVAIGAGWQQRADLGAVPRHRLGEQGAGEDCGDDLQLLSAGLIHRLS